MSLQEQDTPEVVPNSAPNLERFIRDIERYNNQFSTGMVLAEIVIDRTFDQIGESIPKEQKISIEEITTTHALTIEQTGIGIEAVDENPIFSNESVTYSGRVGINLNEGNMFVGYLQSLDSDHIDKDETHALKSVAKNLTIQLYSQYDLNDASDDRMIELLGHGASIIAEYRRLDPESRAGLTDSVNRLEKYIQIAKKGYLREYIAVEKQQLLVPPDEPSFNPAHWQRDISPQDYEQKWKRVILTLEAIRKNPKATELYSDVIKNIMECIMHARDDMDNIENENDFYTKVMPELRITLTDAELRIARLEDN